MISIIVPVYRSEATLERCIKSLCHQSYRDIEIIMTVDGPPDASGILADKLAKTDHRIRVIHQKNQGVSAARNKGMEEAKGEYIQFVDSDDYVAETLCETLLATLQNQNADIALCGFHHLYFGKDVIKIPSEDGGFDMRENKELIVKLYEMQFLNMPWNKLFKKENIRQGFRRDMDLGEDLIFNLEYLKMAKRIAVVNKPLYYYIQDGRGTTLSTKKRENRMENALFLYREMRAFITNLYGEVCLDGTLEGRLLAEFLDEIEGLAFQKELTFAEKKQIIRTYYEGCLHMEKSKPKLILLDYKILNFFLQKKCFSIVLLLVYLRGMLVTLLRKGN